jgi:tol-pal system protein YbgF
MLRAGVRIAGIGALVLGLAAPALAPALAQETGDVQALQERLQRLDRELNAVQQQVYRGGSRPPATPAAAPSEAQNAAAANLAVRINQFQTDLRATTGQIEEINFAVGDMRKRIDKLVGDLDTRLAALEKAFAERPPQATQAAAAGTPAAAKPPPAKETAKNVKLPKGTPKEQYEYAFDFLKKTDYPAAESALKQFVSAHPADPLASNAQYWLAETFFVRNNFSDAAAQFLTGYQKYPKSPKAPDYLYKLGVSLAKLNKTKEACAAFARFQSEYPSATGALRGRVHDERTRLKCT